MLTKLYAADKMGSRLRAGMVVYICEHMRVKRYVLEKTTHNQHIENPQIVWCMKEDHAVMPRNEYEFRIIENFHHNAESALPKGWRLIAANGRIPQHHLYRRPDCREWVECRCRGTMTPIVPGDYEGWLFAETIEQSVEQRYPAIADIAVERSPLGWTRGEQRDQAWRMMRRLEEVEAELKALKSKS